jgi:hypothetical protein
MAWRFTPIGAAEMTDVAAMIVAIPLSVLLWALIVDNFRGKWPK